MSKNLCIIPARGGSKRISRKNIKEFLGKPIISYSIEASLASNLFEEVMVSTDDQDIAEISRSYGAIVPFIRSKKNADDFASTVDVLLEVVAAYQKKGDHFDNICCLYPTAPFVTGSKLEMAFSKLQKEEFEVVFPVVAFSYPIQRALRITGNRIQFFQPEFENFRSQDLETAYHDAGQFYFLKAENLLENKTIFSQSTGYVIYDELEAQDIDNMTDWRIAELKYQLLHD